MAITDNWGYAKRAMTGPMGLLIAQSVASVAANLNP